MEIAKLEALITADIKPLTAALSQAETQIENFSTQGADAFLNLNAGLSKTAQAALAAGTDIRSLTAALDVLQAEQAGVIKGTSLWTLYETEIKKVNGQLDILEAQLPVVATEMKAVAASSSGITNVGKGLANVLSPIRQLAYILPGLGMAGIFNLAFEAISRAADELGIFNSQAKALADATDKAVENISEEANKVSILVSQLRDENLARNDKLQKIKELQSIAPNYFSNLKLEGDAVINLTSDYARFGQAITLVAKIKAASDLNQQNVTKEIQLQLQTSRDLLDLEKNKSKYDDLHLAFVTRQSYILERQLETLSKLKQESKPLIDIITQAQKELDALGGDPTKDAPVVKLEKIKTAVKEIKVVAEQTKDAFIDWVDPTDLSQLNAQLSKTPALLKEVAGLSEKMVKALQDKKALADWNKQLSLMQDIASAIADTFADIFTELITTGKITFKTLTKEVQQLVTELIRAVIQTTILKFILSAISGGAGASIPLPTTIPHFGTGGVVDKPTVALIGESGPEAVIPLNKIQQISNGTGSNITINGILRAQGADMVLVLNRSNVRLNRNYGNNFTN